MFSMKNKKNYIRIILKTPAYMEHCWDDCGFDTLYISIYRFYQLSLIFGMSLKK